VSDGGGGVFADVWSCNSYSMGGVRVVDTSLAAGGAYSGDAPVGLSVRISDATVVGGVPVDGAPSLDATAAVGAWICGHLGKENRSAVGVARIFQ
jgi:hypothetical protein